MSEVYYTAYNQNGEYIKYNSLSDVPIDKQDGAIMERAYREEGPEIFLEKFNEFRKKEAMKEK